MKQTGLLKKLSYVTLLTGTLFISCKREYADGMDRTIYTLSGTAVSGSVSGSQQIPTGSNTTGTLSGTYNAATNILQYTINWKGLSSSATEVTIDGADRNGSIGALFKLQITIPGINGSAAGTVSLYEAQEDGLLRGTWDYVIHNPSYSDGELRGQIKVSPY
jgi:hypothetical protein